ncbi:MAG: hypothetical protein NTW21_29215 [Verrucomicrobia bacterium]|nr:hypothetical protein [Verrucomicrobiota bacterium]
MIPPVVSRPALLAVCAGSALAFTRLLQAATPDPAPATPPAPAQPVVPTQLVLQNGRAVPISAVSMQKDQFLVKTDTDNFMAGASIPVSSVDHVVGDKPAAINQAVALLLTGKSKDARKLLAPVLAEHADTAKLPGTFWLEAARAVLVTDGLDGFAGPCAALGKEISEATPDSGPDPFVALGKALLQPATAKVTEREAALREVISDDMPDDLCAYASFFLAELLRNDRRKDAALDTYLAVPCLYPSGGIVVNGMAQLRAAEILTAQGSRDEALALVHSAIRNSKGTVAAELAAKLLESIK